MSAVHLLSIARGIHPVQAAGYSALSWSFLRVYNCVSRQFEDLPFSRVAEYVYTGISMFLAWGFLMWQ
jgi:hypothetical protein